MPTLNFLSLLHIMCTDMFFVVLRNRTVFINVTGKHYVRGKRLGE